MYFKKEWIRIFQAFSISILIELIHSFRYTKSVYLDSHKRTKSVIILKFSQGVGFEAISYTWGFIVLNLFYRTSPLGASMLYFSSN